MENEIQLIQAVINTMNTIEVRGMKNLDAMLGCIQTLEKVIESLAKEGDADG